MASTRLKMAPVIGSAHWIQSEREQADQFHQLEVEEFGFAATNELEWLNEHMADIFSKDVQRNFADVFKTPGKLRAKTPATARKRDAMAARAPLGDLFAPNSQNALASAANNSFYDKVAQFKVAEDETALAPQKASSSRRSPLRPGKENTDSGYHGITEDEMDTDSRHPSATQSTYSAPSFIQSVAVEPELEAVDENVQPEPQSLHDMDAENAQPDSQETDNATIPDEDMHDEDMHDEDDDQDDDAQPSSPLQQVPSPEQHRESGNWELEQEGQDEDDAPAEAMEEEEPGEEVRSPSDVSSPENRLVRKSSLTFAALPAREPLNRSIGARTSHVDVFGRPSVLGRHTHGKSLGANQHSGEQHDDEAEQLNQAAQEHNKSSTQRLHDRINALGQSKEPRPSKSIPSAINNPGYPVLPKEDVSMKDEDDDDWIAPINPNSRQGSGANTNLTRMDTAETLDSRPSTAASLADHPMQPSRPFLGHHKSQSTVTLTSPGKLEPAGLHKKTGSVSNPDLAHAAGMIQSTTPTSAHSKKFTDAPLSASKAKLFSVLKSAKGIFASSASTSAQAKLDSLASPSRETVASIATLESNVSRMPGGFDNDYSFPPKPVERLAEGRKTRSSTENERKIGNEPSKHSEDPLEKARQQEAQKAAIQKAEREKAAQRDRPATAARLESPTKAVEDDVSDVDEAATAPAPKTLVQPGKLRAPGTGRLVRPTRPATAPGVRPAPVSIKIASQSQRLGTATQPADRSLEPTPDPAASTKTASRVRAGSAQPTGSKANPASTARVRALEAAARKKEQDEKAAQRKVDAKRELERKRAVKAEEERRADEERKAAEQKRVREERIAEQRRLQDARAAAAQKQAEARKLEEQRLLVAQQEKARTEQLAAALEQEKQEKLRAQAAYPRGDVQGTLRQLAQKEVSRPVAPPKSSKRALAEPEDDAQQRPGLQRGPASYQSQDNKRRRTLEEEEGTQERHSVMAPPKRPSNMRKNTQEAFSKFPNGYTHAPPPAPHHSQGMNMYKTAVNTQHQLQHGNKPPLHPNDMLKLSTARIPFADNSNPPAASATSSSSHYAQETASSASTTKTPVFKTPGRPASAMPKSTNPKSAHHHPKSSPLYANGENIALPEIQTDSEDDSDSDDSESGNGARGNNNGFRAPSWVNSPALRDLLTQQQLVDPESVFGPIAPLQMEEVFKGTKTDRLKRFRERGSSARWVESGDAVTMEEKRRDGEMRERLVREGGWSYSSQQM